MSKQIRTQLIEGRSAMRTALLAAAVAAIALTAPTADAGAPVLDGKKVKNLHVVQEAPPGAAAVDPTPEQVASCTPPACARITFVYKPAKGVKAPLSVSERNFWLAAGDVDLYLMQGAKVIASCTGTLSNHRYLSVPASALKVGATYSAVMYYSHEIGESTSMDVDLPGRPAPEPVQLDASKAFPEHGTTVCGS